MTTTTVNTIADRQGLLRRALIADAVVSGATGALMLLAADLLGNLLGLPVMLLRLAGLSLLPFAALVAYVGTRARISRRIAWGIVGYNLLWAIDSILLLVLGWVAPTTLGYLFVIGQALVVAGFAELQYFGLRRAA